VASRHACGGEQVVSALHRLEQILAGFDRRENAKQPRSTSRLPGVRLLQEAAEPHPTLLHRSRDNRDGVRDQEADLGFIRYVWQAKGPQRRRVVQHRTRAGVQESSPQPLNLRQRRAISLVDAGKHDLPLPAEAPLDGGVREKCQRLLASDQIVLDREPGFK